VLLARLNSIFKMYKDFMDSYVILYCSYFVRRKLLARYVLGILSAICLLDLDGY